MNGRYTKIAEFASSGSHFALAPPVQVFVCDFPIKLATNLSNYFLLLIVVNNQNANLKTNLVRVNSGGSELAQWKAIKVQFGLSNNQ